MKKRLWIILGATSIIAKQFAHQIAGQGMPLLLIGRDRAQLALIANDIRLRFKVDCGMRVMDMQQDVNGFFDEMNASGDHEYDLFIGHSVFTDNRSLNQQTINELIQINIISTIQLINSYVTLPQTAHNLLYLSSVAAARGRAKNSLYGASKACIERYLEGLQQAASTNQQITIARLGFIDTKQTYGLPGVAYAASPKHCAKVCFKALQQKKALIYYPVHWRIIMWIIKSMPMVLYKKMRF